MVAQSVIQCWLSLNWRGPQWFDCWATCKISSLQGTWSLSGSWVWVLSRAWILEFQHLGSSLTVSHSWCLSNAWSNANLVLGPIPFVSMQVYNEMNWCILMKGLKKDPCTWNCRWKITCLKEYCVCISVVVHGKPANSKSCCWFYRDYDFTAHFFSGIWC